MISGFIGASLPLGCRVAGCRGGYSITPRASARRCLAASLLVLLAACGGGGDGGGGGTGQALTADYYPDAQQDFWAYDATSNGVAGAFFDTVRVNGTASVLGKTASIFVDANPENSGVALQEYYFKDARAFSFYGNNDPADWISAALAPYDEILFGVPLSNLSLFNRTNLSIAVDLDGDMTNERMDASAVLNFNQFEPLVTAAGRFASAAKATGTVRLNIRLSSNGAVIPGTITITQWRAQNYGLVKEIYSADVAGTPILDTLDIRGLRVNGVPAGYFPPQVLAAGIADANSDAFGPGHQAIGSNGTAFLLVYRQQTNLGSAPAVSKWVARVVLADGTPQAPFDLSAADTNASGEAAVAFDGTNYLVLTDTRIGGSGASGIFGQRVTAAGTVVDTPAFPVAASGVNPAVAFDGSQTYLVAYTKPNSDSIFGVRVLTDGSVGSEFTIYQGAIGTVQFNPSVAFDGTNFLVAWASMTNGLPETTDILGARVQPNETIVTNSIAFSTAPEAQDYPRVACDAVNCLVIWTDRRNYPGESYNFSPGPGDMYGARIDAGNALLDGLANSGGIAIATGITANAGYPALAYTGAEYIAAWSRGAFVNNPGGPTGIYAARIAPSGTVTRGPSSTGVAVSGLPAAATRLYFVSMAAGSNGTIATWLNNNETPGQTKSISGALMYPLIAQ